MQQTPSASYPFSLLLHNQWLYIDRSNYSALYNQSAFPNCIACTSKQVRRRSDLVLTFPSNKNLKIVLEVFFRPEINIWNSYFTVKRKPVVEEICLSGTFICLLSEYERFILFFLTKLQTKSMTYTFIFVFWCIWIFYCSNSTELYHYFPSVISMISK